ncbi:hypothetical protein, partial [Mycoplasmopsis bovis]|uniref:hypothetical protein n=1 Tax=Mycoplasmopsis bovis TaxID=28903 RepID=UPI003D268183
QKVILVLDPEISGSFINKKLVYTAITRAKKELVIIAGEQSFIKSINQRPAKRDTTLTEAIRLRLLFEIRYLESYELCKHNIKLNY